MLFVPYLEEYYVFKVRIFQIEISVLEVSKKTSKKPQCFEKTLVSPKNLGVLKKPPKNLGFLKKPPRNRGFLKKPQFFEKTSEKTYQMNCLLVKIMIIPILPLAVKSDKK